MNIMEDKELKSYFEGRLNETWFEGIEDFNFDSPVRKK